MANGSMPALTSMAFSARVLSATLFPPMFAPVITVAPTGAESETGVKRRSRSKSASATRGFIISSISTGPSLKCGITPPYCAAISARAIVKSSSATLSMQSIIEAVYGVRLRQISLRMRRSSASSLPAAALRSAISRARSALSVSLRISSSISRFSRRACFNSGDALSAMKKVAARLPSGSIIFSASVCAGIAMPSMCALAITSSSTGAISSVCSKKRFSSKSSSSLSAPSLRFITLLRISFMGIISR